SLCICGSFRSRSISDSDFLISGAVQAVRSVGKTLCASLCQCDRCRYGPGGPGIGDEYVPDVFGNCDEYAQAFAATGTYDGAVLVARRRTGCQTDDCLYIYWESFHAGRTALSIH